MRPGRVHTHYYSHVLKLLRENPGLSRIDLSRLLKVNRSTMTALTSELLDRGVIRQASHTPRTVGAGRKPIPLEVAPDFGCVIGVEIQAECIVVNCVNLAGDLVFMRKEMVAVKGDALIDTATRHIASARDEMLERDLRLLGIGIGVTGLVDPVAGVLVRSIPLEVTSPLELAQPIRAAFDVPVLVDNDTKSCCWGVLAFPPERGVNDFAYILVDLEEESAQSECYDRVGIGWGFGLGGAVYYGSANMSGEFRSFLVQEGADCQFSIPYHELRSMKSNLQVRTRFVEELARNIAFVADLMDLSHIVIGGSIERIGGELAERIESGLNDYWAYDVNHERKIVYSSNGDHPVAMGAAGMVVSKLFEPSGIDASELLEHVFATTRSH
jgi:predicted NBD/HSP70 family sugar kinase